MRRTCCAVLSLLFITPFLSGDTVELQNGDRLSGTIISVTDGTLVLATGYSPHIEIDFSQVVRADSQTPLVITVEGSEPEQAGFRIEQDTVELTGAVSRSVPRLQLRSIEPIPVPEPDPSWTQGWSGGADFGWVLARGNSDIRTLSLNVDPVRATATDKTTLGFRILNSRQEGVTSADQWDLAGRYDRTITDGLFAYGLGAVGADQQQDLDLRTRQGAGLGYQWAPGENWSFSFFGGVNAIQEKFFGLDRLNNAEGLLGVELSSVLWGGMELKSRTVHLPIFGKDRYQIAFNAGLRFPVIYGFTYGFDLTDDYDSAPPTDAGKNDLKFLMTVGYKF